MSKEFEEKYLSFLDWLISQAAKQLKLLGVNKFTTLIPADEKLGTCKAKVEIEFNYEDVEIDVGQLSRMKIFQFYRLLNDDEEVRHNDEILHVDHNTKSVWWQNPLSEEVGMKAFKFLAVRQWGTVSKIREQLDSGEIKGK